ncbi:hypothetical protein CONCODRAFT_10958 [Conidiobolus coronatus NRRL 28638]|uniref:Galactose oxidase n=1 Tax=Conidiobolus coronatus (strain ATCC 28846 / CBS 209.66 / NRRL 28638) TaxID=796925 RepID=A0A137NWQ9_CONC2|nr:hypothetical protein CONCODRAFT_10958 [Conidiobolus coronatus NRRL 28638]|eukprot:KXN67064.1 hypothetical protein CONCODRAFT_10958 [Conidiobolus coronatus NRRL 28638]
MYIYESADESVEGSALYVYNMKDGPISDIKPSIVNITNSGPEYTPLFLDLPQNLPKGKSGQLWMMGAVHELAMEEGLLDKEHWTGQIVNDNELRFDSSLIPMHNFRNFPQSAFTATTVNNNNNYELHIIGGLIHSIEKKEGIITNYHFRYDFNSGKWDNLSDKSKSKLQPVAYHRVVQADNSLILLGGLSQNYTKNGNFTETVPSNNATYVRISDVYKFDLTSETWTLVNAKLNLDSELYERGLADGLSLNVYNGKLLSYMALKNYQTVDYSPKLGALDFRAKDWEWTWIDVKNDGGTDNSLALVDHQSLVINDQLILFHGMTNQKAFNKVYNINLKTNKLQSFVDISGKYGQGTGSSLPTWAIILISVICVVVVILILVALWFYFRYKKQVKPNEKNGQKMQDIWAASDVEASRNKKGNTTVTFGNTASSPGQTNTALSEEAMMGYDYFQHEVDTHDMEHTKTSAKAEH